MQCNTIKLEINLKKPQKSVVYINKKNLHVSLAKYLCHSESIKTFFIETFKGRPGEFCTDWLKR